LGRDPEEVALRAYQESFTGLSTEGVIRDVVSSQESWEKQKGAHAEELIREAYEGVLGREPEEEALEAYAGSFKELGMGGLIRELSESSEAWEKQKGAHAEELIRDVYEGVLGRDPEEVALKAYEESYKGLGTSGLIQELAGSQEAWERALIINSDKLVTELYRGIFERLPDQVGFNIHKAAIEREKSLITILKRFSRSEELWNQLSKENDDSQLDSNGKHVFIHVEKTGGTSIHNMLLETGRSDIYHEHTSTLKNTTNRELKEFNIYIGHFELDEVLEKIQNSKLHTIIREPRARLTSLYNFWRSHKPESISYFRGMELTNDHNIEEFFQLKEIEKWPTIWNHTAYALFGKSTWSEWLNRSSKMSEVEKIMWMENEIKDKIKEHINKFTTIGIIEKFENDSKNILRNMGIREDIKILHDHSLIKLITKGKDFKKGYIIQKLDDEKMYLLDKYIEFDLQIYNAVKEKE
jgi:hypothetical protein